VSEATVKLAIDLEQLCDLYAGGNRTCCDTENPLALALDIIEQASDTLHIVHDALLNNASRSQEIANYAWRESRQLTTGIAIVEALQKIKGR